MKRILKSLVCLCAFIGIHEGVYAATLSIGNDSTTAGAQNKSVPVELKDDDLKDYKKVEFQLSVSGTSYAEIDFSAKLGVGLNFTAGDGTTPVYTIENTGDGGLYATTIGTISYSTTSNLNSDFRIVPTNVKFIKADGSEYTTSNQGVKISEGVIKYEKPKSTEATLNSLTVSQGTLSPEFNSSVTDYKVVVKDTINTIRVSATPCTGASVSGTGNKPLNMGENMIELEVTAEDGTTKNIYYLTVIKGEIAEPSAYLESLDINNIGVDLSPKFDSKNNKYTATIGKDISKLEFVYKTEDPLAEVTIDGNEDLIEGENLITITVLSSNGEDEQVYEITVTKDAEESTEEVVPVEDEDDKETEKNNTWLLVLIGVVITLIVGGVAFLLFRRKKKNSKKDNDRLPLKKREPDEATIEEDLLEIRKREEESVTDILKGELFEDDVTQRFDSKLFQDDRKLDDEDELDKTKEFNFKDFE